MRPLDIGSRPGYPVPPARRLSTTFSATARHVPTYRAYRMCHCSGAYTTMTLSEPLLLASASPRRRQLLSLLGLPYEITTSPVDEDALQAQFHGPNEKLA